MELVGVVALEIAEPGGSLDGDALSTLGFADLGVSDAVGSRDMSTGVDGVTTAALAAASHHTGVGEAVQLRHVQTFIDQRHNARPDGVHLRTLIGNLGVTRQPPLRQALLGSCLIDGQGGVRPGAHTLDGTAPSGDILPSVVRLEALHVTRALLRANMVLQRGLVRLVADDRHVHLVGHVRGVASLGLLELLGCFVQLSNAIGLLVL
mmetsp:Transcript_21019/g.50862  ORF Transcript_21019/g.50862 Transcript_21019/m.50862 type:complete len:207 (-) Transcript_21019:98-718(-)